MVKAGILFGLTRMALPKGKLHKAQWIKSLQNISPTENQFNGECETFFFDSFPTQKLCVHHMIFGDTVFKFTKLWRMRDNIVIAGGH